MTQQGDTIMKRMLPILALGLLALPALAKDPPEIKLQDAQAVIEAAVNAPDGGIPRDLLSKAECVGVFPDIKKAAFVVGGEWGRGVFTCRQSDGTMGAPAFFTIGGGSVGWQWGGQEADLVLLIMNKDGVSHLLEDKFTLGGEAAAVAGPVGRSATAATDAQLNAQILSWSRSKGLFLGASLAGHVIKPDKKQTEKAYGKPVSAREILVEHKMTTPDMARTFIDTTTQYTRRES
jgi:lipid-binding SYLF domain-containing protein